MVRPYRHRQKGRRAGRRARSERREENPRADQPARDGAARQALYPGSAMDLSGPWRAALADDDLRRGALGLDYDDDGWETVPVPGHWRSTPAFAESDGPLLYRTRFELDAGPGGARHWVVLDGVFYQADVWLDGAYLGDPEGYFFPHTFEITGPGPARHRARARRRGGLRATAGPTGQAQPDRRLPALGLHGSGLEPRRPLAAACASSATGPVRIDRMRVLCRDADARAGQRLVAGRARQRRAPAPSAPHDRRRRASSSELEQSLATRDQRRRVDLRRRQPPAVVALRRSATSRSDHRRGRGLGRRRAEPRAIACAPGCAQVAMHDWVLSVNGERMFLKGVNPARRRMALGEATPAELRRDVVLAAEAGLDLLRVHGHITRPELYDAADELGMLIWQDFPLQWGYARSVAQAGGAPGGGGRRPARPPPVDRHLVRPQRAPGPRRAPGRARRLAGAPPSSSSSRPGAADLEQESILDRSHQAGARERADGTRPVIAHSGVAPAPPAARRHRQPPLLRLVPRRGARPAGVRGGVAPHGAVRQRVRRAGRAGGRRVHGAGALARPRLGAAAASTTASRRRSFDELRAAGRLRHLRRAGGRRRSATRPTCSATTSRRCGGSSTGRPVASACSAWPTPSRPSRGRCSATTAPPKLGVPRRGRGLPAGHRRRRPDAGRPWPRARPWPSTSTSCPTAAAEIEGATISAVLSLARRPSALAVAGRHPGRRLRPGRHHPVRRARDARPARARPRPGGRRRRRHQPLRDVDHADVTTWSLRRTRRAKRGRSQPKRSGGWRRRSRCG